MTDNPWLDIRNTAGHLLFQYNPFTNEIRFRKGGYAYDLIQLDRVREQYGVIEHHPEEGFGVFIVQEQKPNGK